MTGLLLGSTGTAFADVVTNNLGATTVVNVAPGGTVSVVFKVAPSNDTPTGDVSGCNVGGSDKGTLAVSSTPAASPQSGLAIRPAEKKFQNCRKNATVDFTVASNVANDTTYRISTAMSGGRSDALYSTTANFTLRVVAGLTATTLAISPTTTTVAYGTPALSLSGTLNSGTGASAVGVAGKWINFEIDGNSVGSALTNSSGVATLEAPILGNYPVTGLVLDTTATFQGDATHATSTATGAVTITPGVQNPITITAPTSGSFGQILTITSSGGSGTGTTTYGASGACSLEPGGASVRITSGTGTCTVTGSNPGDANYDSATATSSVFAVGKATQTALSIDSPTAGTFGDLLDVVTSGGSGNGAVTFTVGTSDACANVAGKLSITRGTGTCTVTATKAGTDNYAVATSAPRTVLIGKAGQTIVVTGPTTATFGHDDYVITYTAGSGTEPVTFTTGDSTACSVVDGKLHITSGTGTCALTGHRVADSNYSEANSVALPVTVSKGSATLSVAGLTAIYDGSPHAVTVTTDPAGLSDVTVTYAGSATPPTRAGSYAVVAILSSANYNAAPVTGTLVISPKSLTGAITALGREYDGTRDATVSPVALTGVVSGDVVMLAATNGLFDTAAAGRNKTVTAALSLTGANVADYVLFASTATTTADISQRTVTATLVADDKTYDRTAAATASASLERVVTGDAVGVRVDSASFDSAAAGVRTVTATLSLTGTAASNYRLTNATATDGATISPVVLTGSITAAPKVYDGLRTATVTPSIVGVLTGDAVTVSAVSALFADKNVGTAKAVTANLELTGDQAGNYSLVSGPYNATANITPLGLTGSFTAAGKVYEGTTAAEVSGTTLETPITGDVVGLNVTAAFADRRVGDGKAVSAVSSSLTDTVDAGNYLLGAVTGTTASITPKPVTGAITAVNKVYDGTTTATVTPGNPVAGVVSGDVATLAATNGRFADANVGSRAVTATIALAGAQAGNYELTSSTAGTTADITKLGITGSFTADNKVYDGTPAATVLTKTLTTPITNDDVTLSLTAAFATKDAGLGKVVSPVSPSLTGGKAGNYLLGTVTGTTANITPMPVTGAITAESKVYDGATTATVTPVNPISGLVSGDVASLGATNGQFADANVGNRVVTAAIALTGEQAGNYQLSSSTAGTTANITAAPLTVTASGHTLTAGAAVPTIAPSYAGFVNGEGMDAVTTPPTCSTTYTVGAVGTFPSTCSGAVAANYTPSYTVGVVSATYAWTGFFQPIDALANHSNGKDSAVVAGTVFNKAKAGSSIPVKFSLDGDRGLAIFTTGFPKAAPVTCGQAGIYDDIEEFSTSLTSALKYDATAGQYVYSWKTPTNFAGTCQRLQVKLADGTSHYAFFNFTK